MADAKDKDTSGASSAECGPQEEPGRRRRLSTAQVLPPFQGAPPALCLWRPAQHNARGDRLILCHRRHSGTEFLPTAGGQAPTLPVTRPPPLLLECHPVLVKCQGRDVLEWPHTAGLPPPPSGPPPPPRPYAKPPPLQTKVTVVGENEIDNGENLVGPFLVHTIFWVPDPPSPRLLILPCARATAGPSDVSGGRQLAAQRPPMSLRCISHSRQKSAAPPSTRAAGARAATSSTAPPTVTRPRGWCGWTPRCCCRTCPLQRPRPHPRPHRRSMSDPVPRAALGEGWARDPGPSPPKGPKGWGFRSGCKGVWRWLEKRLRGNVWRVQTGWRAGGWRRLEKRLQGNVWRVQTGWRAGG